METIYFTYHDFYALSEAGQRSVLWEALDYMQSYNGRSKWDCIALAMGYKYNSVLDKFTKQVSNA